VVRSLSNNKMNWLIYCCILAVVAGQSLEINSGVVIEANLTSPLPTNIVLAANDWINFKYQLPQLSNLRLVDEYVISLLVDNSTVNHSLLFAEFLRA
jgi:hypothetical protein